MLIYVVGPSKAGKTEATKALVADPPKIIKSGDPIEPSPVPHVRRSDFPPTDQPPIVVRGDQEPALE